MGPGAASSLSRAVLRCATRTGWRAQALRSGAMFCSEITQRYHFSELNALKKFHMYHEKSSLCGCHLYHTVLILQEKPRFNS